MNIIINLQNSDEEERVMYSNSGTIKFTPYTDVNDVIEKLLSHFIQNIKII